MKETDSPRVNWGSETLHVLGIILHVLFRIFSWFMNIFLTLLLIGLITFLISGLGVFLGGRFGARHRSTAELCGGIILILMGTKILLEHLGVLG